VGRDPEIQVKRPADLVAIALGFVYLSGGPTEIWRIVRHAFGRPDSDVRDFMPVEELQKMYWSSRVYLLIVGGFAVWSIAIHSFLPMMFVWLPRFYGGWLHQLLGLTQHAGLGEDTYDHRENTRTVYVNPVFRYLYMNMNYHVEHHTIPMVPYHALPQLHEYFKPQSPPTYRNLLEVYKEMVPALIKQATEDPDYHIKRPIPAPAVQAGSEETLMVAARAEDGAWVEVCAVADLDEHDVRGFEYNGDVYAVYRLAGDEFYASEGLCTHEHVELSGGLVLDGCIECPKHNGRFDLATGKAVRRPVREDLKMYPVQRRGDSIFIRVGVQDA
jgi:MocE subfamily Rieske [2Fe-2S] domain protein